jgi:predicted dehydrogenase
MLVEASHYRFHPAWHLFLAQFEQKNVEKASARAGIPKGAFPGTDIRYDYDLAGGAAMDLGHYCLSALRGVFGTEPTEVTSAIPRFIDPQHDQLCDQAMDATYTFPNGGVGHILPDLGARGGYWFPWLTSDWLVMSPYKLHMKHILTLCINIKAQFPRLTCLGLSNFES